MEAAGGFLGTSTRSSNQAAYDLYLRSVAAPHEPGPNRDALKALESAVEIDPKYAPAWAELGQRYYLRCQLLDRWRANVPEVD